MPRRSKCRCQVEGCTADLRLCQSYCLKRRICEVHLKADRLTRSGHKGWFRFCSQCGRLEPTAKFDGSRRSCRESLLRRRATATLPGASCHRRHARRHQQKPQQCQPEAASLPGAIPMDCCPADAAALLADAWCRFSKEQHSQEEQQQLAALEQALPDQLSTGSLDGPLQQLLQTWQQAGQQPDSPQAEYAREAHSSCCEPSPPGVQMLPLDPVVAAAATISCGCNCGCGTCAICLEAALAVEMAAELTDAPAATTTPSWCPESAAEWCLDQQQGMVSSMVADAAAETPASLLSAEPAQTSQRLQQEVAHLMAGCPAPCMLMPSSGNYFHRIGCIKEGLAMLAEELAGLEACLQMTGECF